MKSRNVYRVGDIRQPDGCLKKKALYTRTYIRSRVDNKSAMQKNEIMAIS